MVTLTGRGRDAARSSKPPKKRFKSNTDSKTRRLPSQEKRSRSVKKGGRSSGLSGKRKGTAHTVSRTRKDKGAKRAKTTVRKSQKLQGPSGGRKRRPRRSIRKSKATNRYQASNMSNGISNKKSRSVLKRRDVKMKTKRLVNDNKRKIHSKVQRRRTAVPPQRELSDSEDDGTVVDDDSGLGTAADEDSSCSVNQSCDTRLSRASSLYPGPSSRTFRTGTSGPNRTHRRAFRSIESEFVGRSEEDDSDSEDEKACSSCRPLGLGTEKLHSARRHKTAAGAGLADIDPVAIDPMVGFDSIGGLSGHISALKEMVVFPLLYPEFFDKFKIQPPRGCLFYGPPGTGKTLVARALANECHHGNRKVSFFMRKGADCLSKWVGESERQLRLLFEQAYEKRPSIIFFDEIDGLAPVRSSRQEHIHSSIVSTLLSLMDGLDSRGEVVVIGATNRLDSIDPALRRPGRFDRELLFSLPDRESRREILKIYTRQWKAPPSDDFLYELAEKCVGYCGADIRAVCTEAALCALRRRYPQIFGTSQKLLLDVSSISVSRCDFVAAMRKMKPASQRSTACPAKPLSPVVRPLLGAALLHTLEVLQRLFPHAGQGMKRKSEPDLTSGILDDGLMSVGEEGFTTSSIAKGRNKNFQHFVRSAVKQPTSHRPRMLLAGRPESGQTSHLAPAVLHTLEHLSVHSLDSAVLFGVNSTSPEEACAQVFCEAKQMSPSILYIPHIQQWWETAGPALRASFLSLLGSIPPFSPILLLATCSVPHQQLDPEIQLLFREDYGEVYTMGIPTRQERIDFFHDLILNQAAEPPPSNTETLTQATEVPPQAPQAPLRQLSEQKQLILKEQEEDVLRELSLFLRKITERLMLDRRFKVFTKPVDTEEVPDYLMVIKKPMDLSTLLTNIEEHKYVTIREFVSDADLIWQNALEYNPNHDPVDRQIRHQACVLRNTIRAIVRDELEEDFERVCEEIQESRIKRGLSCGTETNGIYSLVFSSNGPRPRSCKKKRCKHSRKSKWSTGVIKKPKRKRQQVSASDSSSSLSSKASSDSSTEEIRAVETRGVNGSAGLSSSSSSECGDGEKSHKRAKIHVNVTTRARNIFLNGYSRPEQLNLQLTQRSPKYGLNLRRQTRSSVPQRLLKRGYINTLEKHRKLEMNINKAAMKQNQLFNRDRSVEDLEDKTPPLVVDHNKLMELLNRAVVKTEGAEVEPLEKLYALLAQSIYRHRNNPDKTELIKEMKAENDRFS